MWKKSDFFVGSSDGILFESISSVSRNSHKELGAESDEMRTLIARYLIPSLPGVSVSASQILIEEIQHASFLALSVEERADYAPQPLGISNGEQ